jgi:hypothetical protein
VKGYKDNIPPPTSVTKIKDADGTWTSPRTQPEGYGVVDSQQPNGLPAPPARRLRIARIMWLLTAASRPNPGVNDQERRLHARQSLPCNHSASTDAAPRDIAARTSLGETKHRYPFLCPLCRRYFRHMEIRSKRGLQPIDRRSDRQRNHRGRLLLRVVQRFGSEDDAINNTAPYAIGWWLKPYNRAVCLNGTVYCHKIFCLVISICCQMIDLIPGR